MDARTLLPLIPHPFKGVLESLLTRLDSMEKRIASMEKAPPTA